LDQRSGAIVDRAETRAQEEKVRITITAIEAHDIRFPTSAELDGSDAMNIDPDYSAAYCILRTNHPDGLEGHGLAFTNGRGNEVCTEAIRAYGAHVVGAELEAITSAFGAFWWMLASDSQLRWLGPEKGVMHLAMAAVVNAIWDLHAKVARKPLWQLLSDMTPDELVACIPFRYITDALTPDEATEILRRHQPSRKEREAYLRQIGYPAYTTSSGWLGYPDDKVRRLCRAGLADGWTSFKMKVGRNGTDNVRRAAIVRSEIGPESRLMMDANQVWEVDEAIEQMRDLAAFNPWWIEEPTNPDDVLGHARIATALSPLGIRVATGENCHNRIMFKQLFQANAIGFCQLDPCRLGGVNEVLAVLLMAAKFGLPVCPHAGGVGLCEYVQHLSIFDYLCVSASLEDRITEYVDHLHEHFVDPVVISGGRYMVPRSPGYSITMKPESRTRYRYPDGAYWRGARPRDQ